MKSFNLTKERRARVWLHDLPHAIFDGLAVCRKAASCQGDLRALHKSIGVELFIPTGGLFSYGLLGVQLLGVEVNKPVIEISGFPRHEVCVINDSLAGRLDAVVPWIDEEYYAAILAGAGSAADNYATLPERVQICSGRQGLIGSSPEFFYRLAFICVTLLAAPEEDIEQKIEELVSCSEAMKWNRH